MERYDVIIIGAGPAGLKCAEILGGSELKVLLIEKNKTIGPKACAGLMTSEGIKYLNQDVEVNQFKECTVHSIFGKTKVNLTDYPVYTIDRKKLGQWQLKKLEKMDNITVRTKTFVNKIGKDYVLSGNNKIKFKYLVGADGSSSITRRHLGLKINKLSVGIGIHYIIPTKKYKKIELFFDAKLFKTWYAWILPHNNYASIGAGCDLKILSGKKLAANFHKWLRKNDIDVSKGKYEAYSLNYDYQEIHFENKFLIGDAAGLIYKFTGEGIYPALVSGEEAAKKIMDNNYKLRLDNILKKKRKQDFIASTLMKMGILRIIGHELIVWSLKYKILRNKVIKLFL
jgi:geranylgeranyl reductase family protein